MKILFVNSAYPKEIEEQLLKDSGGLGQPAVNVFQWAVIDGLEQNGIDYSLACAPAVPSWPRYHKFLTPLGNMRVNGICRGHYLRYCAIPVLNQITRFITIRNYVQKWCQENCQENRLVVICYTQQSDRLGAIIALKNKFSNLIVVPIITDLIENAMEYAANRRIMKRIQIWLERSIERSLFPKVDKFVLLTEQMTECIPEAKERYVVMEGVPSYESLLPREPLIKNDNERVLFYAGTFQEYSGVRFLIDAFLRTTDPRFRLVLCGRGGIEDYVKQAALTDKRVVYKGSISHEDVVLLQRNSTLLINPRLPNGGITKYSFPSKTMEYMTSHTPMIGYHLEGIPMEYYEYMFTPENLSIEALTDCISSTLSMPLDILQKKADAAASFIKENKNCAVQIAKVLHFLEI